MSLSHIDINIKNPVKFYNYYYRLFRPHKSHHQKAFWVDFTGRKVMEVGL